MNWIKRHIRLVIIMIVIVVLVAIIVVSLSDSRLGSAVENAVQGTAAIVEKPLSAAGNGISSFFGGLFNFRDIQRENYQLKQENEELNSQLVQQQLTEVQLQELRELYDSLNYVSYDDEYQRVTADVIAIDNTDLFNTFTIDAGENHGIEKDDVVISADGLVGKILSVGDEWAKVAAIIDGGNSVSFTLVRDTEISGVISGNGEGSLDGYIFDESKSLIEGDTLITSGMGYYPAGIEIGKVTSVSLDAVSKQKIVKAESSVDLKSLRIVTVLTA